MATLANPGSEMALQVGATTDFAYKHYQQKLFIYVAWHVWLMVHDPQSRFSSFRRSPR
jgi:hypothetical protein